MGPGHAPALPGIELNRGGVTATMQEHSWSEPAGESGADPEVPSTGLLIIRTWHEPGHPQGFRARITYGQTAGGHQDTVSTADPAEVLKVVKRWLAAQPGVTGRN